MRKLKFSSSLNCIKWKFTILLPLRWWWFQTLLWYYACNFKGENIATPQHHNLSRRETLMCVFFHHEVLVWWSLIELNSIPVSRWRQLPFLSKPTLFFLKIFFHTAVQTMRAFLHAHMAWFTSPALLLEYFIGCLASFFVSHSLHYDLAPTLDGNLKPESSCSYAHTHTWWFLRAQMRWMKVLLSSV